mgnify:CR=1 FL=1
MGSFNITMDVQSERIEAVLPDEGAFAAACAALPEWRRRKCDGFRFEVDRRQSVAAWELLRRMLAEKGVRAENLPVTENEFGKPAFDPAVGFHFNISHAKDRVLAAIGDRPLGCDVERIGKTRADVVKLCFAADERDYVLSFPEGPDRDRAFCRVWVRKESYVKAVGKGMSIPFKSFSACPGVFPSGWSCEDLDFGDGSLGAVCTLSP